MGTLTHLVEVEETQYSIQLQLWEEEVVVVVHKIELTTVEKMEVVEGGTEDIVNIIILRKLQE